MMLEKDCYYLLMILDSVKYEKLYPEKLFSKNMKRIKILADSKNIYRLQKMRTCGLLPGWYGLTSQDLLTGPQMFQNPDQHQDNWLKDQASQTAPVKIGPSS
ncbi:hypothetical protein STEG23_015756 [Scotinomys teguina]